MSTKQPTREQLREASFHVRTEWICLVRALHLLANFNWPPIEQRPQEWYPTFTAVVAHLRLLVEFFEIVNPKSQYVNVRHFIPGWSYERWSGFGRFSDQVNPLVLHLTFKRGRERWSFDHAPAYRAVRDRMRHFERSVDRDLLDDAWNERLIDADALFPNAPMRSRADEPSSSG